MKKEALGRSLHGWLGRDCQLMLWPALFSGDGDWDGDGDGSR